MPIITNSDAAREALAGLARRVARALTTVPEVNQHADRLTVRTDQLTTAQDQLSGAQGQLTAALAALDQAEARARDAAAAQRTSDAAAQSAYDEARARVAAELAAAHARTGRALDDGHTVLEVLLNHGHTDAVRTGGDVADSVAKALAAAVPEGSEITQRIADVLWQTGRTDVGGAVEHVFLSPTACRELAFVLAPVVAGWLRAAGSDPTTATPEPAEAHR